MTTKAETATTEKEATKAALEARAKEIEEKESVLNKDKKGKGLRFQIGLSRGRNPQMIQYEAFDDTKPETLPTTMSEFMELSGVEDEKRIVSFLIDGFNSEAFTLASDPVAEFVEASWPADVQKMFKVMVKGYSVNAGVSIEDAVALMKPAIVAQQEKAAKTAAVAAAATVAAPVAEKPAKNNRK